ncbi:MAG: NUDIX domain-containing protein [Nitrososphaerota archaeon]|nr:NUDIX domain-containing protein [Nitrososphaerota archaeon]
MIGREGASTDDEPVDVYDDSGKKVGVSTRLEAHKKGLWHYNFHCWIVTRRHGGSLLFQLRSEAKPSFPGLLDSTVGGHYSAGERLREVSREIEEEIGVRPDLEELVPIGSRVDVAHYDGVSKREVAQVFLLRSDRPLTGYRLYQEEVRALIEVRIEDGLKLFSGGTKSIAAHGAEWDEARRGWKEATVRLTRRSFVPKMDSYYMSLFIAAKSLLSGERYISI